MLKRRPPTSPLLARNAVGAFAIAAMLFGDGCTQNKSRLEAPSDESQEAATQEEREAEASLPQLPAPPAPPPGLAKELWSDIHWLPANVVGVNGTPPGKQPFLAAWVFSQPSAEHESCRALEQGLIGGYGIEWEQPPQSFVFYGNADLEQIEECATRFMQGMGGTARLKAKSLELSMEGSQTKVLFAQRGEQLVVIADDGRMGPISDARSGRLEQNQSLISLLGDSEPATMAWSVSTRDMTRVPLGVSSRGYALRAGGPGQRWELRFKFADGDEARRASKAVGPFLIEAETFLGVSLHASVQEDADTLVASFDLAELFTLEPAKMQALQQKLEEFAGGRREREE